MAITELCCWQKGLELCCLGKQLNNCVFGEILRECFFFDKILWNHVFDRKVLFLVKFWGITFLADTIVSKEPHNQIWIVNHYLNFNKIYFKFLNKFIFHTSFNFAVMFKSQIRCFLTLQTLNRRKKEQKEHNPTNHN